jgi:hypothetical protein
MHRPESGHAFVEKRMQVLLRIIYINYIYHSPSIYVSPKVCFDLRMKELL